MTPKAHALLSSIAAIKDGAADEYQALMLKLDDLEARLEGLPLIREIRDGITRLSHSVISAHDTAAVLAEPMHMADIPAPVVKSAPVSEPTSDQTDQSAPEQTPVDPGPGLYASRRKGEKADG